MPLARRGFIHLAAAFAIAPTLPGAAAALDYPTRPIRLMVGFPPGGPNDILGRMIAGWLSDRLGQKVEVENLSGASGNIATEAVVRAPADGYTLLVVGPANAINPTLTRNLGFDFLRDIAPVASFTREPLVMAVHPDIPARNVAEFIALAKINPGQIKMAATGTGSSPHVSGELFMMLANVELQVVQFGGGGPALQAMIAGETDMMFEPISAAIQPIRDGRLRALAVTTSARSPALPAVPILAETVPGYEASATTGIGAPRGTPAEIVERLNRDINAAFVDPAMTAKIAATGGTMLPGGPADFGRLLVAETEKWARVIRFSDANSK